MWILTIIFKIKLEHVLFLKAAIIKQHIVAVIIKLKSEATCVIVSQWRHMSETLETCWIDEK